MPCPSRVRRIAKWTVVVVCVVLAVVWAVSTQWHVRFTYRLTDPNRFVVSAAAGALRVARMSGSAIGLAQPLMDINFYDFYDKKPDWSDLVWLPESLGTGIVVIPIWIPFAVTAVPTAFLFYRDRRHPRGHCQGCGYDLKGNVSGRCPECGKETDSVV